KSRKEEKTIQHHRANDLSIFSCVGPVCEDHCCSTWKVTIDKTYYDLCQTGVYDVPKQFLKKYRKKTKQDYGYIEMNPQGICPCLTKDKLC
ncbi:hypothetical protein PBMB05447_26265, partial [Bacillus thuringiensis F14-1]